MVMKSFWRGLTVTMSACSMQGCFILDLPLCWQMPPQSCQNCSITSLILVHPIIYFGHCAIICCISATTVAATNIFTKMCLFCLLFVVDYRFAIHNHFTERFIIILPKASLFTLFDQIFAINISVVWPCQLAQGVLCMCMAVRRGESGAVN